MKISKNASFLLLLWGLSLNLLAQTFTSSNLPIIIINTNNQAILDEPKTKVEFKIIYNGVGKRNNLSDPPNHYNGYCGIEYRGSTSQTFPKKPYGLEIWNEKGESQDVSLFGFPKESDFVLFASYNEKSFIHNALTMKISREMGMYASRTQYVELVLNGEYQGLYVFMEKVKRATGRVEISKLKPEDINGDNLTGGYIIKIDKSTGTNIGSWQSKYTNNPQNPSAKTNFFYEYPKDINEEQKNYIKSYVDSLETALYGSNYDLTQGYPKFLDANTFAKFLIINEVAKNVDGYRISTFMYKDKNSKGGKLKAGPPWDYDISYGNANYCDGNKYTGFSYNFNVVCSTDYWLVPFWWEKMLRDPNFVQLIRENYVINRKKGILQTAQLMAEIDSMSNLITESQARNFQKWNILGTYVWPQPTPIPQTWKGEVDELKNWLNNRMAWLDANMPGVYGHVSLDPLSNEEIRETSLTMKAYPNPFIEMIQLHIHSPKNQKGEIKIYDELGNELFRKEANLMEGENRLELNISNEIQQRVQLLKLEAGGMKVMKKMIRE